ncbi:hypothetical protein PVAP13_8NG122000 [Panicum virgatum]|uniref:Uncharacterized protein n=1 Tax=Panicum virgatum TaxID=38727 RepID=A0A8T0P823_PANVG|nr:hypothetical protein PVAP13_8NG122000 [Panicum virgatum]
MEYSLVGPFDLPDRLDSESDDDDEHPAAGNYSRSRPWPRRLVFRSLDGGANGGAGSPEGSNSSGGSIGGRGHVDKGQPPTAGALGPGRGPLRFGRLPPPRLQFGRQSSGEWPSDGAPLGSIFADPIRLPLRLGSGSRAHGSKPSAAGSRDDPALVAAVPYPASPDTGFDSFDPMLEEASFSHRALLETAPSPTVFSFPLERSTRPGGR